MPSPTSNTDQKPKSELLYDPVQIRQRTEEHPSVVPYVRFIDAVTAQIKEADEARRRALREARIAEKKIFRLMDKRAKQSGALSVVRQYIYNQLVSQAIYEAREKILNADQ